MSQLENYWEEAQKQQLSQQAGKPVVQAVVQPSVQSPVQAPQQPSMFGLPTMPKNSELYGSLKNFLVQNGVITHAAGMTIGFSTGVFIRSAVGDMLLPLVYKTIGAYLVKNVSQGAYDKMTRVFSTELNVDNFLKETITWIFVIVSTFLLIEYGVRRYMLNNADIRKK